MEIIRIEKGNIITVIVTSPLIIDVSVETDRVFNIEIEKFISIPTQIVNGEQLITDFNLSLN